MMTSRTRFGERWDLPRNTTARLPDGSSCVVRVERGTVLVTQEGDLEDHVLERGDELMLTRPRHAVAWAFTDAALSVRPSVQQLAA